jgi:DNA-binding GntR family transcriptional regulator
MRSNSVFKHAFNRAIGLLPDPGSQQLLPSENSLRRQLEVSRTTVRKILAEMQERRLIEATGIGWQTRRTPLDSDRFPEQETTSRGDLVERLFMEWMLRADTRPDTLINELDLARQFQVATSVIREFLIRFSRFGLVEKRPNSGWLFRGFNRDFALELFEVRLMFELRSAQRFVDLPPGSPIWDRLRALRDEHLTLQAEIDRRYQDFSNLDTRLHLLVHSVSPNRFIDDFHGVIALIFHYHYQWNKVSERARNGAAITEHLDYIDALISRDPARIENACRSHLNSARTTLIQSLIPPTADGVG